MKGVTFEDDVLVTEVSSRPFEQEAVDDDDDDDDDEGTSWYTPDDYNEMRQRDKKLSHELSKAATAARLGKLRSIRVQFHGMESADQKDQRRKRTSDARGSVIFEQADIWDEEEKEEIAAGLVGAPPRTEANLSAATARIAFVYSSYSVEASRQAAARAIQNAEDVLLEVYCSLQAASGIAARRFSSIRREDSATSSNTSIDGNGSPPRQTRPTIQFSSRSVKRRPPK
jgi:hypothetical protein